MLVVDRAGRARQRDLGTALVLFAILLGDALGGRRARPGCSRLAMSIVGVGRALPGRPPAPSGSSGCTNFTDPFKDFHGAGWQPAHGLYALSSGGWFGEGIGASQQKWGDLPEAHTDFIFAVLGEELGLVGTLLVLALFLTIAYAAHPGRDRTPRTRSCATVASASSSG